ncbi:MAG: hypothetical protein QOH36_1112 [Actinomycetota bacterium]|nr:hypothetical protein [Actinomycetota bacterium]
MDILTTELFRFTTAAGPDAVWRTLTSPALTTRYFHGLALESDWQPGSPVTARSRSGRLVGEVLAVAEHRRLSFTLAADHDQPETFVTWEIHDAEVGSIIRLYVDEPDGDDETEVTWLPVISALQAVLADAEQKSSPTSH